MNDGMAGRTAPRIAPRITEVREQIALAAGKAGRDASEITLVAVSKNQPQGRIDAALAAGLRVFGENRVQEAMGHWQGRGQGGSVGELRLIGGLQTNKVPEAVALFDVIETIDREKLARAVARETQKTGKTIECLVQVNTGMEAQKSGVPPQEAVAFAGMCRDNLGLNITGLMCIPPVDEEPAMHFALLAKLGREADLRVLSMGMSGDYTEAILFGATHVRIGTALFGERET